MKEKVIKFRVSRESAKGISSTLRKSLEDGDIASVQSVCAMLMKQFAPLSLFAFPVESVPAKQEDSTPPPTISPGQEKLEKLYSNVATNIWRIKNQIMDTENDGETKEELDSRAITKIARYINSLETALANNGVEVVGDFVGKPHREGSAVKVISYEDRQDLTEDTYVEVLMPTVRFTTEDGHTRLLQPAEVVVGRPKDNQ